MLDANSPVWVYVLRSLKDGKRYIGLSADPSDRLHQHNSGKVTATKGRRPFVLTHKELRPNLAEARSFEKYLKTASGRRWLDRIEAEQLSSPQHS